MVTKIPPAARRCTALLVGLALIVAAAGPAAAAFPYPTPPEGHDPYSYEDYARTSEGSQPSDLGGLEWKYTHKTACDQPAEEINCDPTFQTAPGVSDRELRQVTGASVTRAWNMTTGRPEVVIAVHDSGIIWDEEVAMLDLADKTWLNEGELPVPGTDTFGTDRRAYDVNADGVFNLSDYCSAWRTNGPCEDTRVTDLNGTGYVDPEDLIFRFSDGVDQDANGYVDDFVGWDSYEDDNDPYDEVHYGHGTGEAEDSTAEANNGGTVGTCPNCLVMHMRVGNSFIADVNDFAQGVVYAADNGASVIQSALGTLNNSRFAQEAIDYAYRRGVVLIASAADESAGHHNQPSVLEHAVTLSSVRKPAQDGMRPPSYLQFNGCTNYGAYITATVPSTSCSSEAVGRGAGMAGLIYSAAINEVARAQLTDYAALESCPSPVPPGRGVSAEEVDQLISTTADDLYFTDGYTATTPYPESARYPATKGWDPFFGYGRVNARRMVQAVEAGLIPPEADITSPQWFEIVDPDDVADIAIQGRVASCRTPGYTYKVEWAPWTWRGPIRDAYQKPAYTDAGVSQTRGAGEFVQEPLDGTLATIDAAEVAAALEAAAALDPEGTPPGTGTSGPAVDPVTGRGDHENRHIPDKFGVIVRVVVTAMKDAATPVTTPYQGPEGGGDPNADGPEVPLVAVATKNFNFHQDPALFDGFPIDLEGDGAAPPKFADIDDDGRDEIIVATSNGEIHAFQHPSDPDCEGRPAPCEVAGFPLHTRDSHSNYGAAAYRSGEITTPVHAAVIRSPAIGDLDRDGDLELLVQDFQGRISAFTKRDHGTPDRSDDSWEQLAGWPVRSDPLYSTPQRPDREGGYYDAHPELLPGHHDGPLSPAPDAAAEWQRIGLPNDPDLVPDVVNRHDAVNRVIWWFVASPSLGNLDKDRALEILAPAADRHVYGFEPDGSRLEGWPVMLRDGDETKIDETDSIDPLTHEVYDDDAADRFDAGESINSVALGDADRSEGDRDLLEVYATVNEQYDEPPNSDDPIFGNVEIRGTNAGNNRLYRLHRSGAAGTGAEAGNPRHPQDHAYVSGWPARIATLLLELLPVVGGGPDGAPVLGNVNGGDDLEVGIFGTAGPGYVLTPGGVSIYGKDELGRDRTLLTEEPGEGSNSADTPSIPAVGGAIFSDIGPGPLAFVAPAAGIGKLLDVALPEDQLNSDNHLAAWNTIQPAPGQPGPRDQLPAFPREVNDLQFLSTAASADIDGDGDDELLAGTAYSDLHAFNAAGLEPGLRALDPMGWPKFTAGWTVGPPGVGDFDDDGSRDIAHVVREGWFFTWRSNGGNVCDPATWPEYGHDNWMTNNVETDAARPRVIRDLAAQPAGAAATLTWSAPGDDGTCGAAHSYDILRSPRPITTDNAASATVVADKAASAPGTTETYSADTICGTYHYAIRTWDADPDAQTPARPANTSAVSNTVSVTRAGGICDGGGGGGTAPGSTPTPTPGDSASATPTATGTPDTTPAGTPATTPPATEPGTASTTITASDRKVRFMEPFRLAGRVTGTSGCSAPYEISIHKRTHGKDRTRMIRTGVTTDANGSWRARVRSKVNADYLAEVASTSSCTGERSGPVAVKVRALVKISRSSCADGQRRVRGWVGPPHRGTRVLLQVRRERRWITVDRDRLNQRSRFAVFGKRCRAKHRVVWPEQSPRNLRGATRV